MCQFHLHYTKEVKTNNSYCLCLEAVNELDNHFSLDNYAKNVNQRKFDPGIYQLHCLQPYFMVDYKDYSSIE